jgi:transcriptional regulator with XRE-family HTH domain
MQNSLPSDIQAALDKLRLLVTSRQVSQTDVSLATGVDQSQISRILAGQVRRVSGNVIELCKFANNFDVSPDRDPSESAVLMSALRSVWDGTPAHAEAIASVLLSLRKFKEVG